MEFHVTEDVRSRCSHCGGVLHISSVARLDDGSKRWSLRCKLCHKPGGSYALRPSPIYKQRGHAKNGSSRRARWSDYEGISGVYAFVALGTAAVKVGWSDDVSKRLNLSSMYCPFGIVLVGVKRTDDKREERLVHRALKEWALRGEWFIWCDSVRKYLSDGFELSDGFTGNSAAVMERAITSNPLLDTDEFDSAASVFYRAIQTMPKSSAAYLSQWIDPNSERPLTCEDLARFASGRFRGISRDRYRQYLFKVAHVVMAASPADPTAAFIANGLCDVVPEAREAGAA
jgi:hypothetical protein